jgi:hypothetical protein
MKKIYFILVFLSLLINQKSFYKEGIIHFCKHHIPKNKLLIPGFLISGYLYYKNSILKEKIKKNKNNKDAIYYQNTQKKEKIIEGWRSYMEQY